MEIPPHVVLSVMNPFLQNLTLEAIATGLDEFSILAAVVLVEASNRSSFYRPFLCSLPRSISLPVFWPLDRLNRTGYRRDTRFIGAVEAVGRIMIRSFKSANNTHLFQLPSLRHHPFPSFRAWQWACSIILSRSWGVKVPPDSPLAQIGGLRMVHILAPLADMMNHQAGSEPNCRVIHDSGAGIRVTASSDIAAGAEVTISYGHKCNMELMSNYGFDVAGNPQALCEWDRLLAESFASLNGNNKTAESNSLE